MGNAWNGHEQLLTTAYKSHELNHKFPLFNFTEVVRAPVG